MAKNREHAGPATATANPEQLTREIEGFLSTKQTAISQSIDQLLQHKKEIDRKAEEDKRSIDGQVEKLNDLYYKATNRYYLPSRKADTNGATEGRGGRRSREALETDAKAILDFILSKGKEGVRGSEIKARFPRIVGGIKSFLGKYTTANIRTEGEKSQMRYFGA